MKLYHLFDSDRGGGGGGGSAAFVLWIWLVV